jgi:hypothetical protein
MLHLRVEIADVHRRLLVSVLGMLPDEVGTDAGGDAPAGSRHGSGRLITPEDAPICRALSCKSEASVTAVVALSKPRQCQTGPWIDAKLVRFALYYHGTAPYAGPAN